jgi:hypothetical protein
MAIKRYHFSSKKIVWLPILSSESVFRAVGKSENPGGGANSNVVGIFCLPPV